MGSSSKGVVFSISISAGSIAISNTTMGVGKGSIRGTVRSVRKGIRGMGGAMISMGRSDIVNSSVFCTLSSSGAMTPASN